MNQPRPKGGKRELSPDLSTIREALSFLSPDVDRDTWVRIAMAIKSELGDEGFDVWDAWSQGGAHYKAADARSAWRGIKPTGGVTIGTLFGLAKEAGFRFADDGTRPVPDPKALQRAQEEREKKRQAVEEDYRRRAAAAQREAVKLWDEASATGHSPYLARKGVGGHGVRYLADGTLLVPLRDRDGMLHNLQRIFAKGSGEKSAGAEKRFLPGGRKSGLWHIIGDPAGDDAARPLLLAEGYATGATVHEASGYAVAVAFDAGNLAHVAKALREVYPERLLLVCGDDDRETEARTGRNPGREKAATAARAAANGGPAGAVFPEGLADGGTDFNDLAQHRGLDEVRAQLAAAVAAPSVPGPRRQAAGATDDAPAGAPEDSSEAPWSHGEEAPSRPAPRTGRDPFFLSEEGVYHSARDAEGNDKPPVWLCAPLRVAARTRTEDANGWGYLLEFTDPDGNHKTWAMPSALLSGEGAEWAGRLRDMGLRMAPGTRARNLVAQYIDTREPEARVVCADRVGWHPGGVYVLPSQCVGGSEANRYVFQSDGAMEDTFRRAGTLSDWQRQVGALCEGNSRLVFGVCCALAGPVLRPAGIESGGFHFRGASSQGKTTALKVAASVWGRPTYMQRWRTTDNALESTAVQHCDGLLILDEIGQVDGKVVGDCAYLLANEQEKGRSTKSGLSRKRRTWRLLFLSSGEKSMSDHMAESGRRVMAGQEVRLVDIPLDAGAGMGGLEWLHGYDSAAELADAITSKASRHYGTAGMRWLEWLAVSHERLESLLLPRIDALRRAMVPEAASEQVRRVGTRFALVAAAGELAIEAGVMPWRAGAAADAARDCFNAWLGARGHMDNGEEVAMVRQVRSFLEKNGEALFTYTHRAMDDHRGNTPLRAGFRRLVDESGKPLQIDGKEDYIERHSLVREREAALVEYLILPEQFQREVCKGFEPDAVAKELKARGFLRSGEGDRLVSRVRLPGLGRVPVYHILPAIFTAGD